MIYSENGYHLHDHITYGITNTDVPISSFKERLFQEWSKSTFMNGFGKLSKNGFDVSETFIGDHSDSRGIKSIEDSRRVKGTLDHWEFEYW